MARSLWIPRIRRCTPHPAECAVCKVIGLTILFDCDLLARVCEECGEAGGVVELEFRSLGVVAPDHALCKANP